MITSGSSRFDFDELLCYAFNFECEYEYVNAVDMYNIAIPSLKDQIYHYIKMLDKTVEGIAEEFVKVKSGGARSDHNSESSSFSIESRLSGFFNYKNEDGVYWMS